MSTGELGLWGNGKMGDQMETTCRAAKAHPKASAGTLPMTLISLPGSSPSRPSAKVLSFALRACQGRAANFL